jgi:hypothetical protein
MNTSLALWLENALVLLVVLAAAWSLLRRFRGNTKKTGCGSGCGACGQCGGPAAPPPPTARTVIPIHRR